MSKKFVALALLFAAVLGITWHFRLKISYIDFKAFADVLLNVSGMVFTLMAIWIAVLYPNALRRLVDEKIVDADFSEASAETKRLESIVGSILASASVVSAVMAISFAKMVLTSLPLYSDHIVLIRSIALGTMSVLFAIQIQAILSVISANIQFVNDLHRRRQDRKVDRMY
jgi:hypothetical protein